MNGTEEDVCLEGEVCIDNGGNTVGACTRWDSCDTPADCPLPPPGGDASVVCAPLGGEPAAECVIDCSGGDTCPSGMVCAEVFGGCFWPTGPMECPDTVLDGATPLHITETNLPPSMAAQFPNGLPGDNHEPSCAGSGGGLDYLVQFTAPTAGQYQFDTLATNAEADTDTSIAILDGCDGPELACNDDADFNNGIYQSSVTLGLTAGQTVIVVVDSDAGIGGEFTLTIDTPAPVK